MTKRKENPRVQNSSGHVWHDGCSRTYNSWRSMLARCSRPNHRSYAAYGGRGIKVCDEWALFANFLRDMGEAPPGMTIDRDDTNGDYTKANCRWATQLVQQSNRRNNRNVTIGGETLTVAGWCRRSGIPPCTAFNRMRRGWDDARAVTEPTGGRL